MEEICNVCGLPQEICVCEEIAREQQQIRIFVEKRRYGKVVTVIDGINSDDINMDELARKLKMKCASGGTVKDSKIELQGDHKKKVQEVLSELGFTAEVR